MRLLIADDESFTREGLCQDIDWKALGIEEVMEAEGGEEALKIAEWFQPDIILTDVRMPRVDGIMLAKKLLDKLPDSKILFMSAFMEIGYLKKAIQLSAVDYIEKPIDIGEVIAAVRKGISSIDEKRASVINHKEARVLHSQRLAYLLKSKKCDMAVVEKLCEEVGFPLRGKYNCCVFRVTPRNNMGLSVQQKLQNFFDKKKIRCAINHQENNQYIAVLGISELEQYHLSDGFFHALLKHLPSCYIGLGFEVNSISAISESYQVANKAVCRSFYYTDKQIHRLEVIDLKQPIPDPDLFQRMHELLLYEPSKLPAFFDDLLNDLVNKQPHPNNVKSLFLSFAKDMIKQNIIEDKWLNENAANLQEIIEESETLEQIKDFIMKLTYQFLNEKGNKVSFSPFVREVTSFISKHYPEKGFGLSDIAEHMKVSVPYLSEVFKKETEFTIRWYIENCRIEHAKNLLRDSRCRIIEISEACGFSTSCYFSKVFRDATGYTPTEYKELQK